MANERLYTKVSVNKSLVDRVNALISLRHGAIFSDDEDERSCAEKLYPKLCESITLACVRFPETSTTITLRAVSNYSMDYHLEWVVSDPRVDGVGKYPVPSIIDHEYLIHNNQRYHIEIIQDEEG